MWRAGQTRTSCPARAHAAAIAQLQEGIAAWRAMDGAAILPQQIISLAEAYGRMGRVEEALSALEGGWRLIEDTGELCWEAELCGLKEALLLAGGGAEREAEVYLQRAVDVACRQHARSWELRAATSLARLWQAQGKRTEARELLQGIYGWFSEGFDTADLQAARNLLHALA